WTLFLRDGKVNSVSVDMGAPDLSVKSLPADVDTNTMINYPLKINGEVYLVNCVSVGNPHCVIFKKSIDDINIKSLGPCFEYCNVFPERINTEFVRVVNRTTLRMRVWERGNGETLACGTGACAAVVAAVENGYCDKNTDITVKLSGGDLTVNYSDNGIMLTGNAVLVYKGEFEY
ncbi:MAG: diaminopimelate epimerase, partial [Clostridia bacterium]|nr:diaminopimelate epimerase [Clostridia bacterium]